ncbi:MAG: hypothetical protein IKH38_02210 [Clostridia bacterium]|nr:hypothetical protein [Clostridia bacterium]
MTRIHAVKYLSLLLALVLLTGALSLPGLAEENLPAEETVYDEAGNPIEFPEELRVGHPTETRGDFFTEMFGNNTADIDVRALIHGYNLVSWDQNQGVYLIDESVVEQYMVVENELGDRTYFLGLYDDLYYSDGTPITAWDYAFSLLLMMSPEIEAIGGKIYRAEHIQGSAAYLSGQVPYLSGVGVIDDHQLAITLDHEFLPYFFETGLLLCVPYPISVIAPGCRVYADGQTDLGNGYGFGAYIGNEDASVSDPVYTAALLEKTILDPETGYNSHPSVCSGPYVLTDYDGVTAHFELNDWYKGAWIVNDLPADFRFDVQTLSGVGSGRAVHNSHTGPNIFRMEREDKDPLYLVKSTIEKISFSVADYDTMAEDLANGTFHLVNKAVYEPAIRECLALGTDENGTAIRNQNYPRVGLAFLTFTCDWPAVHEKEVRQAIAWCMDREALTRAYCGDYGQVVNGYYGIEQWEYLICTQQMAYPINLIRDRTHRDRDIEEWTQFKYVYVNDKSEYEEAVRAWKLLTLENLVNYNVYDLRSDPDRTKKTGVEKANALLDAAGWTLNRSGEPYQAGTDDVRCKQIDGELVALDLTMMVPAENHILDTMQENFFDHLAEAGIRITPVPTEADELFRSYYRETERTTDMIYLATNFHAVVDPSITYSTDKTANHQLWNNTYSDDEDLYWRAVNMRKTDPRDVYDYIARWIAFQERYNEVLPAIPLYSNIYYDFYSDQLQNYWITAHVTWTQAILEAYFGVTPSTAE